MDTVLYRGSCIELSCWVLTEQPVTYNKVCWDVMLRAMDVMPNITYDTIIVLIWHSHKAGSSLVIQYNSGVSPPPKINEALFIIAHAWILYKELE